MIFYRRVTKNAKSLPQKWLKNLSELSKATVLIVTGEKVFAIFFVISATLR